EGGGVGAAHACDGQGALQHLGLENADAECGHSDSAESCLRRGLRVWALGLLGRSPVREEREKLPHLRPVAQWPVNIEAHHPGYLSWEEFVSTQLRLRQNWNREGSRGVAREGTALLQGLVVCGRCGRTMTVQHRVAREGRSPSYMCQQGYSEGDAHIC